jgi:hypothetical protein
LQRPVKGTKIILQRIAVTIVRSLCVMLRQRPRNMRRPAHDATLR